jgi:hypothetical protein
MSSEIHRFYNLIVPSRWSCHKVFLLTILRSTLTSEMATGFLEVGRTWASWPALVINGSTFGAQDLSKLSKHHTAVQTITPNGSKWSPRHSETMTADSETMIRKLKQVIWTLQTANSETMNRKLEQVTRKPRWSNDGYRDIISLYFTHEGLKTDWEAWQLNSWKDEAVKLKDTTACRA